MPIIGGSMKAGESGLQVVTCVWKPEGAELTTVGPTVYPMFAVKAGDRVLQVDARVRVGHDGAGVAMLVGDGDDDDGFMDAGDITEATPALYAGNAANTATMGKLYLADDNVDLKYTGNAGSTVGQTVFRAVVIRGEGHF